MLVEPLDATFGATVHDVELADLDADTWDELHATWLDHALLIFPGQFLTLDAQNAFARRFGGLELEAFPLANIDADGTVHTSTEDDVVKMLRGNEGWHHDSTFMPVQAKGAVFSAEIVPTTGGATGWADMRAAYDDLDEETRDELSGLSAFHSLRYSQGRAGYLPSYVEKGGYLQGGFHGKESPLRPLVKVHPDTGRPNLLIGRHAYGVVGMEPDVSEQLLDRDQRLGVRGIADVPPPVGGRRRRRVGQPAADAPGDPVRSHRAPAHVAHPHRRRARHRDRHQLPLTGSASAPAPVGRITLTP